MAVIWIQSAIWSNRLKTALLLLLFPVLLFGTFFTAFFAVRHFGNADAYTVGSTVSSDGSSKYFFWNALVDNPEILRIHAETAFDDVVSIFIFLWPVLLVWCLIAFWFHRSIIFSFTGARPIERREYPELYNIVENLCISRWLPTPNIGILEDDSCNAFAVGWNPKKAWIVFSRGIVNTLDKKEIEAVAAHELTHIINKDGLLMVTIIVFIGAVAAIGEILFRTSLKMKGRSRSWNKGGQAQALLFFIGIVLMALGYLVLPLVQFAISRKREYLADAGSVELTHDKFAMIGALSKISQDSVIESIEKDSVSALCISSPFPKKTGFRNAFHEFFSTHPSTEDRIRMLEKY